jgi:hypothetical protein
LGNLLLKALDALPLEAHDGLVLGQLGGRAGVSQPGVHVGLVHLEACSDGFQGGEVGLAVLVAPVGVAEGAGFLVQGGDQEGVDGRRQPVEEQPAVGAGLDPAGVGVETVEGGI